ncbi:MAG: trypsin-like peptidase domain-containing protein [Reyranellaceae bacterium]
MAAMTPSGDARYWLQGCVQKAVRSIGGCLVIDIAYKWCRNRRAKLSKERPTRLSGLAPHRRMWPADEGKTVARSGYLRYLQLLAAGVAFWGCSQYAVAQGPASAFDRPGAGPLSADLIRTVDVQKALVWTQHYSSMVDGDFGRMTRAAVESWQRSQGFKPTGMLEPEQATELVRQGMATRDHWGWTTFRDDSVGYSIGYPGRAFSPGRRLENGGVEFTTSIPSASLDVRIIPKVSASSFKGIFDALANPTSPDARILYSVRTETWFVVSGVRGRYWYYQRAELRPSGLAQFAYRMDHDDAGKYEFLITAIANGFKVDYDIRPHGAVVGSTPKTPSPPPPAASSARPADSYRNIDRSGKVEGIKLKLADETELRPQDVFRRVSGSVFVLAAFTDRGPARDPGINQGSAVAISNRHLLTNCHVVRGADVVFVLRGGSVLKADVVSANADADRCVLRAEADLPVFVSVRPFADLNVGEPVYSIGAPQGLELSMAPGIVSSKRTFDGGVRFIQTSAPISPGSSGGGLFDAYGNLVGVTTMSRREAQNVNFAIPAEDYVR